jgi:hypothetical protein
VRRHCRISACIAEILRTGGFSSTRFLFEKEDAQHGESSLISSEQMIGRCKGNGISDRDLKLTASSPIHELFNFLQITPCILHFLICKTGKTVIHSSPTYEGELNELIS